jgi:rhamnulokinase
MGLWIVDRLKDELAPDLSYEQILGMADAAEPFGTIIHADDPRFFNPKSMKQAVDEFCAETGQDAPADTGAYLRTALEGIAFLYRRTLNELRELQDQEINRLHILGGGCRNAMLCRMAADATGLAVYAGPVEGTATGNLVVQAMASGRIDSLAEARRIVRNSFEVTEYWPSEAAPWDDAWPRFEDISGRTAG